MSETVFALLIGAAVGAGGAWLYCTRAAESEARMQAEAHAAQMNGRLQQIRAAQERGDHLTRQLAAATQAATRLRKERDDALQAATDGRTCLDERALRVLDGAAGLRVSPPAGGAAAAHAGRAATDHDLARWALEAGERYAECAARLDALIRWQEGEIQQGGMP